MSDNFTKPLFGAYVFGTDAHRALTVRNLYLGGDSVTPTVTSNAATLNASLGSSFYIEDSGNTAIAVSNIRQGQELTLVYKALGGARTPSFTSCIGAIVAVAQNNASVFRIYKVKTHVFVTQTSLGSYT